MCAIMSWGAHEYFMHPTFVLKNGCDSVESFGRSIMVSRLRFPLAISTVYHYKLRQLLA
jgi:hypothetical protein